MRLHRCILALTLFCIGMIVAIAEASAKNAQSAMDTI
jgi:hypothetical protein